MNQYLIAELADKVSRRKTELRNALLARKCSEQGRAKNRLVLPREITLTREEKEANMRQAFQEVLASYPSELRLEFMKAIGKELNRRKQERRAYAKALLDDEIQKLEEEELSSLELQAELTALEEKFRREEEYRAAIELLLEAGRAAYDENGGLIIFNARDDE